MKYMDLIVEGWDDYMVDQHPRDRRMLVISNQCVEGMNTENIRYLINETVRRYAQDGCYLEVGCWRGASLLSAALFNPTTTCVGVDNFEGFNEDRRNAGILDRNLGKFEFPKNIKVFNMDYRTGFAHVPYSIWDGELRVQKFIDVYFYDGHHDYEDQMIGLEIALPFLNDRCIIMVDDPNEPQVDAANRKFLERHREFTTLFEFKHPYLKTHRSHPWWNGMKVMGRGYE